MQVAVYRFVPTAHMELINGEWWEKQRQEFMGILESTSVAQAAKDCPHSEFTLSFYEVKE